jgi:hypothetical protein
MFGERRKHQRHVINRLARLQTDSGTLPGDCLITDMSPAGARLFFEGECPDRVFLVISAERPIREECQVIWRLGGEIGVRFVTGQRERELQSVVDSLRAEASKTFKLASLSGRDRKKA